MRELTFPILCMLPPPPEAKASSKVMKESVKFANSPNHTLGKTDPGSVTYAANTVSLSPPQHRAQTAAHPEEGKWPPPMETGRPQPGRSSPEMDPNTNRRLLVSLHVAKQ